MARTAGTVLGVTIAVVWLLVGLGLLAVIGSERVALGDQNCPVPGVDTVDGEASWQWWSPGEVCSLHGTAFSEPPGARGWMIVAEIVVGGGLVISWRRLRDAPEVDWTA